MIIMGLDPGTARVGWGVIEETAIAPRPCAYGLIETEKNTLPELRLQKIYTHVTALFKKFSPQAVSIEDLFFAF